ncbi:tetratricopeptide repeat protein [Clostridium thermarum]|uniref:tetratricopeptide repeat protein n=1 Tax=Clostridium thermarum TaxID=1716543 RepID=UPI0013D10654|nr:hypothetical protein [Clostridium thermarum]
MQIITSDEAELYCSEKLKQDVGEEDLKEIIEIASGYRLNEIKQQAFKKLGELLYFSHRYTDAFSAFCHALKLTEKLEKKEMLGYMYNFLGACKYEDLDFIASLEYFDKAVLYAEMYKDEITELKSLSNISKCYRRLSWLDRAIQYADLCMEKAERTNQVERYIYASIIKINCYEDKKEYDIAIKLCEQLICKIQHREEPIIGNIYNNLGGLYLLNGDFENSLKNFDKSIKFRAEKDRGTLSHTLIDKAQLYIPKKMYMQAIELLKSGCKMALQYNDYDYALRSYRELINVYEAIEAFDSIEELYIKITDLLKVKNFQELQKVYLELSKYYIKQGKLDKADEFMKLSLEEA